MLNGQDSLPNISIQNTLFMCKSKGLCFFTF